MDKSTLLGRTKDERAMDNSTVMDNINDERGVNNKTLMERLNDEYMISYIPVFVYFSLVLLFGTFGNCISFFYYRFKVKRIPQTQLIASLAFIDMLICLVFVAEFFNLAFTLTFKSEIGCKFSTVFLPFLPAISHLIHWLICIERYIKMCKPKWRQFYLTSVKIGIALIIVIALALSIPHWFWRGISTVTVFDHDNNPITVHYCSERGDKITERIVIKAVSTTILVLIMLTFLILYSLIGHKRFVTAQSTTITIKVSNASEAGLCDGNTDSKNLPMTSNASEAGSRDGNTDFNNMPMTPNASEAGLCGVYADDRIVNKIANISKIEWKFTLMVFMMTAVMVVALVPLLVATIMVRFKHCVFQHRFQKICKTDILQVLLQIVRELCEIVIA